MKITQTIYPVSLIYSDPEGKGLLVARDENRNGLFVELEYHPTFEVVTKNDPRKVVEGLSKIKPIRYEIKNNVEYVGARWPKNLVSFALNSPRDISKVEKEIRRMNGVISSFSFKDIIYSASVPIAMQAEFGICPFRGTKVRMEPLVEGYPYFIGPEFLELTDSVFIPNMGSFDLEVFSPYDFPEPGKHQVIGASVANDLGLRKSLILKPGDVENGEELKKRILSKAGERQDLAVKYNMKETFELCDDATDFWSKFAKLFFRTTKDCDIFCGYNNIVFDNKFIADGIERSNINLLSGQIDYLFQKPYIFLDKVLPRWKDLSKLFGLRKQAVMQGSGLSLSCAGNCFLDLLYDVNKIYEGATKKVKEIVEGITNRKREIRESGLIVRRAYPSFGKDIDEARKLIAYSLEDAQDNISLAEWLYKEGKIFQLRSRVPLSFESQARRPHIELALANFMFWLKKYGKIPRKINPKFLSYYPSLGEESTFQHTLARGAYEATVWRCYTDTVIVRALNLDPSTANYFGIDETDPIVCHDSCYRDALEEKNGGIFSNKIFDVEVKIGRRKREKKKVFFCRRNRGYLPLYLDELSAKVPETRGVTGITKSLEEKIYGLSGALTRHPISSHFVPEVGLLHAQILKNVQKEVKSLLPFYGIKPLYLDPFNLIVKKSENLKERMHEAKKQFLFFGGPVMDVKIYLFEGGYEYEKI